MARFTRASTKYINACKNIEVQPIRLKFNTWKERNLCTFLEFDNIRVIFSSWFETDFKRNSSIRCLIHDSWIKFYVLWISSSNITDPFLFMETEYKIEIQKFEYHSWVRCHCFVKTLNIITFVINIVLITNVLIHTYILMYRYIYIYTYIYIYVYL